MSGDMGMWDGVENRDRNVGDESRVSRWVGRVRLDEGFCGADEGVLLFGDGVAEEVPGLVVGHVAYCHLNQVLTGLKLRSGERGFTPVLQLCGYLFEKEVVDHLIAQSSQRSVSASTIHLYDVHPNRLSQLQTW